MGDFAESANFGVNEKSINDSYLIKLIETKSRGPLWEQGAVAAYSACIQAMVQRGEMSYKKIANILDEPEKLVRDLCNPMSANLARMTGG